MKETNELKQNLERVRNKQFEAFPYDFLHAPIVVTMKKPNNCIYIAQVNPLPSMVLFLSSNFDDGLVIFTTV